MRPIKFRAWDKFEKEWTDPPIIDGENGLMMGFSMLDGSFQRCFSKDEIALMQYTGLKDKNGTEIYEGDICKSNFGEWNGKTDIKTFIVYWHGVYGSWAYATNIEDYKHGTKVGSPYGIPSKSIEVVGNICEHPHLLGSDNDE